MPEARVQNKRIAANAFRCEIQVVDTVTGQILEEASYEHVLDYVSVDTALLQVRVDALKAELLQRVQNRNAIDLDAIS